MCVTISPSCFGSICLLNFNRRDFPETFHSSKNSFPLWQLPQEDLSLRLPSLFGKPEGHTSLGHSVGQRRGARPARWLVTSTLLTASSLHVAPHGRSRLSAFTEAELDPEEQLCSSWSEVPESYAGKAQVRMIFMLREGDCCDNLLKYLCHLSSSTVNHTAKSFLMAKSGSEILTSLLDHPRQLVACTLLARPHSFPLNRGGKEWKLVGMGGRSCPLG